VKCLVVLNICERALGTPQIWRWRDMAELDVAAQWKSLIPAGSRTPIFFSPRPVRVLA